MSIQEKVTGRLKQAAGDLTGDEQLHRKGVDEERKAEAKQELRDAQRRVEQKRAEIDQLEHRASTAAAPQPNTDNYSPADRSP